MSMDRANARTHSQVITILFALHLTDFTLAGEPLFNMRLNA